MYMQLCFHVNNNVVTESSNLDLEENSNYRLFTQQFDISKLIGKVVAFQNFKYIDNNSIIENFMTTLWHCDDPTF